MSDEKQKLFFHRQFLTRTSWRVGHIAAAWAAFEAQINHAIWSLASVNDRDGACLTAQIPAMLSRMRALIALVNENGGSGELIKDLNRFSSDADGLARRRNRVIHDPWLMDTEGHVSQFEVTADRKLESAKRPVTPEEMRKLWEEIHAATKRFADLRKRIALDLQASIDKQRAPKLEKLLGQLDPDSGKK